MSAQGATMRGVLLGALVASQLLGQRPDLDD